MNALNHLLPVNGKPLTSMVAFVASLAKASSAPIRPLEASAIIEASEAWCDASPRLGELGEWGRASL